LATEAVHGREAVDGPGQAARPDAIRTPALVRARSQKAPAFEVEDPLVRRAAVGPYQVALGRPAMLQGKRPQRIVPRGVGGPEDDADVHHDVDEQRLRADE